MRTIGRFLPTLTLALASVASLSGDAGAWPSTPGVIAIVEHRVAGVQLRPRKSELAVPKGIKGSLIIDLVAGQDSDGTFGFGDGAYVRAILHGPAYKAQTLYALPGEPMMLPPLAVEGVYSLDRIELVAPDRQTVLLEGTPASVTVTVFDKVLVSQVVSRPLSLDEIQAKGIVIDDANFSAVEFAVGLVIDGETFAVTLPVVSPRFEGATELVPPEELQQRLVEADAINQGMKPVLPEALQQRGLDFQMVGVNFQVVDPDGETDLSLKTPPIPGLMLIPGRIGFLNQFFSVQLFTANASPAGSDLSVHDIRAELVLPPGADGVRATAWDAPGDDPLRMARVTGPDGLPVTDLTTLANTLVTGAGADGEYATADDQLRLLPGEGGRAEFLVEGLREGLHLMDIKLSAVLDGFGHGEVPITGYASGAVMVRNPNFSLAFSHPQTVRAGEPYEASVTILNTALSDANLVSISLPPESISGATLTSPASVEFTTVASGESVTATFTLVPTKTGEVTFSNINSDGSLNGAVFWLRMGVDERGVELSPDAIGYPREVSHLPASVRRAADRVLGQALSVSTAAKLPPTVRYLSADSVTRKVIELAEAGQRVKYGDSLDRVLADLLLDWQGARYASRGFDQIMRETDAGRAFREALLGELLGCVPSSDSDAPPTCAADATTRLTALAADLAGRGEAWTLAAANASGVTLELATDGHAATLAESTVERAAAYAVPDRTGGHWLATLPLASGTITWRTTAANADLRLMLLTTSDRGTGTLLSWRADVSAGECLRLDLAKSGTDLARDTDCNGVTDDTIGAVQSAITERAPEVVGVVQDVLPRVGRPKDLCVMGSYQNYGTVLAVLYSKPMDPASVNTPGAYRVLGRDEVATGVSMQPGGRVALVNVPTGLATFHPRDLAVAGVADPRGHALAQATRAITLAASAGAGIKGQVIRASGNPAAHVPVLLTYFDQADTLYGCETFVVKAAQVMTDADGHFTFDFILADVAYSITAFDTFGLGTDTAQLLFQAVAGDQVSKSKLYALANDPTSLQALYAAFGVTSLDEALARVQGLDRVVRRDMVPFESGSGARLGSDIPVALRFRGRGHVTGHVYAIGANPDSHVPVGGAAVNLFPPHDALESPRGMFSRPDGTFAFAGVPLGVSTIDVKTSDGRHAMALVEMTEVGAAVEIGIELAATDVGAAILEGRVFEADGVTPHASASVYVGEWGGTNFTRVVGKAVANPSGGWHIADVPPGTWDLVALSFDGKRYATRMDVVVVPDTLTTANLKLPGTGSVSGIVTYSDGTPAEGATVVAGWSLTTTDPDGRFELTDIPTGPATVAAGIGSTPDRPFPRLGAASLEVVPGVSNTVAIRFGAVGAITGCVTDALGAAVPDVKVSIPRKGGFAWVAADKNGCYLFAPMPLGPYFLSAPAPPVFETDVSGILESLGKSPSDDELLTAIGEAYAIFAGVNDPLLTGAEHNPLAWGYAPTSLTYDGQVLTGVNIRYQSLGTVAGTVTNGQGTPIGAEVRLTGIGPDKLGALSYVIRGDAMSDPALGTFAFDDVVLPGSFGLQAATPFYATVATADGWMPEETSGDVTKTVNLTFPPDKKVNGALGGLVLDPGGTPVVGASVRISFGDDYVITTNARGEFCTLADCHDPDPGAFSLPAVDASGRRVTYAIEASQGLSAVSTNTVIEPGAVTFVTLQLTGVGSLEIHVTSATGAPVGAAEVSVAQVGWPHHTCTPSAGSSPGTFVCAQLSAGTYAISAKAVEGQTWVYGRAGATVANAQASTVTVTLGGTARLTGHFLASDQATPVADAQVTLALGGQVVALAATDAVGAFAASGLPLGTYTVTGQNPVTGKWAVATKTLSVADATYDVTLVEQALGTIYGVVWSTYQNGPVPGAEVVATFDDPMTPSRSVTTGQDGVFELPASPPGKVRIGATDVRTGATYNNRGAASDAVPQGFSRHRIDVSLAPLADLIVQVFEPDGVTPNTHAEVTLGDTNTVSTCADASACTLGTAQFLGLPLGTAVLAVEDLTTDVSRAKTTILIQDPGTTYHADVVLPGAGSLSGRVADASGAPCGNGLVERIYDGDLFASDPPETALTDADGRFTFAPVAVTAFHLAASCGKLGAWYSGALAQDGDTLEVPMTLGAAGTASGRILRADGATPVAGLTVVVTFDSLNAYDGIAYAQTDAAGGFVFAGLPASQDLALSATLTTAYPAGLGRAAHVASDWREDAQGWSLAFGDIVLDEAYPTVLATSPIDGADDAPALPAIAVTFSEPLSDLFVERLLTPGSHESAGLYLADAQSKTVPTTVVGVSLDQTTVTLEPLQALASEARYDLIVLAGARYAVTGGVIALGPYDHVERSLESTFAASFAVADVQPPVLLSLSPDDHATQADPSAVIRLSFDDAIASDRLGISLTRLNDDVPIVGTTNVGGGGLVAVFTPREPLKANAAYRIDVTGLQDAVGNLVAETATGVAAHVSAGALTATFKSVDTSAPTIKALTITDGLPVLGGNPEVGAPIAIQAELDGLTVDSGEKGLQLWLYDAALNVIATSPLATAETLVANYTPNAAGSFELSARISDQYGNEGPRFFWPFAVDANRPPAVSLTVKSPSVSGQSEPYAIEQGASIVIAVAATDLTGVSQISTHASGAIVAGPEVTTGATQTFTVTVPLDAPIGASLVVASEATDVLGLTTETPTTLTFAVVRDERGPRLASWSPAASAIDVPASPVIRLTFDEALAPGSVSDGMLVLAPTATPTETVPVFTTIIDATTVAISPLAPLAPSTAYTLTGAVAPTDAADDPARSDDVPNAATRADGAAFTTFTTSFTTAVPAPEDAVYYYGCDMPYGSDSLGLMGWEDGTKVQVWDLGARDASPATAPTLLRQLALQAGELTNPFDGSASNDPIRIEDRCYKVQASKPLLAYQSSDGGYNEGLKYFPTAGRDGARVGQHFKVALRPQAYHNAMYRPQAGDSYLQVLGQGLSGDATMTVTIRKKTGALVAERSLSAADPFWNTLRDEADLNGDGVIDDLDRQGDFNGDGQPDNAIATILTKTFYDITATGAVSVMASSDDGWDVVPAGNGGDVGTSFLVATHYAERNCSVWRQDNPQGFALLSYGGTSEQPNRVRIVPTAKRYSDYDQCALYGTCSWEAYSPTEPHYNANNPCLLAGGTPEPDGACELPLVAGQYAVFGFEGTRYYHIDSDLPMSVWGGGFMSGCAGMPRGTAGWVDTWMSRLNTDMGSQRGMVGADGAHYYIGFAGNGGLRAIAPPGGADITWSTNPGLLSGAVVGTDIVIGGNGYYGFGYVRGQPAFPVYVRSEVPMVLQSFGDGGNENVGLALRPLEPMTATGYRVQALDPATGAALSKVEAGVPFDLRISAVDENGQTRTDYTGTVTLECDQPGAVPQPDHEMRAEDQGTITVPSLTLLDPYVTTFTLTDGRMRGTSTLIVVR